MRCVWEGSVSAAEERHVRALGGSRCLSTDGLRNIKHRRADQHSSSAEHSCPVVLDRGESSRNTLSLKTLTPEYAARLYAAWWDEEEEDDPVAIPGETRRVQVTAPEGSVA
ncbi:MAG: hypothetical protein ACJATT_004912 [Myxococcota bacterium]|jgi:hypothetical protein